MMVTRTVRYTVNCSYTAVESVICMPGRWRNYNRTDRQHFLLASNNIISNLDGSTSYWL